MRSLCLAAFLALTCGAFQYPGQYPPGQQIPPTQDPSGQYPPGQYPGGQRSPGTGGLSLPGRRHKNKESQKKLDQQPTIEADGATVSNDGKKLLVATADGRVLTMTIVPETKWTRGSNNVAATQVQPRSTVHVVAAEDDEAFLTAMSVNLLKDAPSESADAGDKPDSEKPASHSKNAPASDEDMARPTIMQTPDAPGRPVLKRGKAGGSETSAADSATTGENETRTATAQKSPPKRAKASSDGPVDFTIGDEPAETSAKHKNAYDQLIDQTREWAATFTNGLPNFLCQQSTTRYLEQSRAEGFQPVDVVTAKVLYEDGREKYSEITVGGKRTNKSMMEIGGSTSTGEFASVLGGLFEPVTQTEFKFYQSTTVQREPAVIYDMKVALPRSNWTIVVGGQLLRPAYSGSIWVDKATAQVRRIEMQADNVPKDFPQDTIASAVDFEEVPLGAKKFLLPVHAENLSCQRGTTLCSKNTIDFRDYHKYAGESTIEFK